MAFPSVIIKILNMMNGSIPGVAFHFLFVGYGTVTGDVRNLIMVDASTDLDEALAKADPALLTTLKAAQLNGKSSWTAGVMIIGKNDKWQDAVSKANETSSFEAFVLNFPATDKTLLEEAIALRTELKSKLGREVFAMCTTPAIDTTTKTGEDWATWLAATVAIQKGVASEYITVVPQVHLTNSTIGIYAGRLANQEVSIADSPARVKTGSILGSSDLAIDKDGKPLELAYLKALESNRYSLPMWYPDYPGQYWTTGRTLEVPGGDFQDIRHIRVAMKAARNCAFVQSLVLLIESLIHLLQARPQPNCIFLKTYVRWRLLQRLVIMNSLVKLNHLKMMTSLLHGKAVMKLKFY